jgi:hypothetical protein
MAEMTSSVGAIVVSSEGVTLVESVIVLPLLLPVACQSVSGAARTATNVADQVKSELLPAGPSRMSSPGRTYRFAANGGCVFGPTCSGEVASYGFSWSGNRLILGFL